MPSKLENIDHVHINVTDRAAAEKWYRETLGFVRESPQDTAAIGKGPLTLVNGGNIQLALFESPDIQNTVVAFKVSASDLAEWISHLSALGIHVDSIDHKQSWSIYFRDLDGNPFEITTAEYKKFRRENT